MRINVGSRLGPYEISSRIFERNFADFDVARDGRILLVETPQSSASAGRMNVVLNWFEEIRKERRQPLAEK